eukprot:6540772-Pyramimonas_sp.AAC.1
MCTRRLCHTPQTPQASHCAHQRLSAFFISDVRISLVNPDVAQRSTRGPPRRRGGAVEEGRYSGGGAVQWRRGSAVEE